MRRLISSVCAGSLLAGCSATTPHPQRPMQLQRVILYQNGIGYFERAGHVQGETLKLSFASHELDDVLKTLTVIDPAAFHQSRERSDTAHRAKCTNCEIVGLAPGLKWATPHAS